MQAERPYLLTVAGYDPCGGAGIIADIKTFEQLRVMGLSTCTAITTQTEDQCFGLNWVSLPDIMATLKILLEKYPVKTVKIGLVKNAEMLYEIITTIRNCGKDCFVIWDPVLKSSSEFQFFDLNSLNQLMPSLKQIDLITPNLQEYQILMPYLEFSKNILVKGGHRTNKKGTDILISEGVEKELQPSEKNTFEKHGTGCVLSSAIAAYYALGNTLENSCKKAKIYIEDFMASHTSLLGFHNH